ncbi:MAG: hypothetical protein ACOX50_05260 [Patescibacteria group bacterium]|jgi:hypothetical protein
MIDIKRILLVNGEFPPISGGGGIYTANLAQGLAEQKPQCSNSGISGNKRCYHYPTRRKSAS